VTPITIGLIGIGVLLLALFIGIPIAFALALVGVLGLCFLVGPTAALGILPRDIFEEFYSYPLTVITMFVLMGSYAFASGMGKRSYDTSHTVLGHLPGGLAIASVGAATAFGAVCGSAAATAATIGKIALPEMKHYNYGDTLATGCVASSAGLGILVPPSSAFIVYGVLTEQSIGKLFVSGIFPALILAALFTVAIVLACLRNPALAPPGARTSWKEKVISFAGLSDTLILFVVTMGGLFTGWFSPTQAGAVGAGGTLLIGIARRQLDWQEFLMATKDGLVIACMVLCLIAGATVFGHFMALSTVTTSLLQWMTGLPLPPIGILAIMSAVFFIFGCFIDTMPLIVILVPLFFPVVTAFGFDPIWFGVIIVLLAAVGLITPPVGVAAFVVKGVAQDVPLESIFKGVLPFIAAYVLTLAIVMIFPQVATFLPSMITY
jgi:C4-dicarboxylate transporter DctM subunit